MPASGSPIPAAAETAMTHGAVVAGGLAAAEVAVAAGVVAAAEAVGAAAALSAAAPLAAVAPAEIGKRVFGFTTKPLRALSASFCLVMPRGD